MLRHPTPTSSNTLHISFLFSGKSSHTYQDVLRRSHLSSRLEFLITATDRNSNTFFSKTPNAYFTLRSPSRRLARGKQINASRPCLLETLSVGARVFLVFIGTSGSVAVALAPKGGSVAAASDPCQRGRSVALPGAIFAPSICVAARKWHRREATVAARISRGQHFRRSSSYAKRCVSAAPRVKWQRRKFTPRRSRAAK